MKKSTRVGLGVILAIIATNAATFMLTRTPAEPEALADASAAGEYPPPPDYVYPEDPLVLEKLEKWQDWKFGLMMHWGPYSQWGVVESWSICSEDEPWCARPTDDYNQYVRDYENLQTTFNPVDFSPDRWADAASYAGMKYVVFTTKHHDGFSMFDTDETDYSITGPLTPFSTNPKANITSEIFSAFRDRGFGIGAYFSKADWHHEDYWAPNWATPDRNVNYDTAKYPDRWQRFKDFTFNQIQELMTNYGSVDILWLDGGWVRPSSTITSDVAVWCKSPYEQDIDMDRIARMARERQPGLIIVDRTVAGPYENYRTPEQHVPDEPLDHPWETCMTMGGGWSYTENANYKSTRELVHYLVDIVSKGGNYLLNIGPSPQGDFDDQAYTRLREIGDWMAVNGKAIYETKPIAPYAESRFRFTSTSTHVFAIYLSEEAGQKLPETVSLNAFEPARGSKVMLLGSPEPLDWKKESTGTTITIPSSLRERAAGDHAWVFQIDRTR